MMGRAVLLVWLCFVVALLAVALHRAGFAVRALLRASKHIGAACYVPCLALC